MSCCLCRAVYVVLCLTLSLSLCPPPQAKEVIATYVTHDPNPAKPQLSTQIGSSLVAGT